MARRGGIDAPPQLPLPGLTTVRRLGAGAFGEVFSARDNATGQMLVVKRIPKGKVRLETVKKEVDILRYLEPTCRPYILCFKSFQQDAGSYYILTEFLDDFATLDEVAREGTLDETRKAEIARQLVAGLAVIHSRGVAHRDIKPQNVMVTKSGPVAVKYIDFGLACLQRGCNTRVIGGTPGYMPTELYSLLRPGTPKPVWNLDQLQRTDLWSLGLTIWELVQGQMTLRAWQTAVERWMAVNRPQILRSINQLPPADRAERWRRMFVNSFNYNSPTDQLAPQNRAVESFLAAHAAPSLRSMLDRVPGRRTLPSLSLVPRAGGHAHLLPYFHSAFY